MPGMINCPGNHGNNTKNLQISQKIASISHKTLKNNWEQEKSGILGKATVFPHSLTNLLNIVGRLSDAATKIPKNNLSPQKTDENQQN